MIPLFFAKMAKVILLLEKASSTNYFPRGIMIGVMTSSISRIVHIGSALHSVHRFDL